MKKILLTLLLLLGIGYVAQAQETAAMTPSDFTNSETTAYTTVREYTSDITGITYKIGAWVENGKFQQNATQSCFFQIVDNPIGHIIDKVTLVDLAPNSNKNTITSSFFTAQKGNDPLTITNGAPASKKNPTISGGVNVVFDVNNDCFEADAKYFGYVVTTSAKAFKFSGIEITYQDATDGSTQVLLLYDPSEQILNLGDEFVAPSLSATIGEEDCFNSISHLIEYKSSNPELLDVTEDGTMIISHDINDTVGTAEITASLKSNDTYIASPAVFTLHVVSPGNGQVLFDINTDDNYEQELNVESINKDVVTLTFDKGSHMNTAPRYYNQAVRIYQGNTMTVSVPKGYVLVSATATPALNGDFEPNIGSYPDGKWEPVDAEGNMIETNTVTFAKTTSGNYQGKTIIVSYRSDTEVVGFEHNLVGHGTYATLNYTIYINKHDDDLDYYAVKLHIDEDGHYSSEQHEIREYEKPQGAMMRVSPAEGKTYTHIATGMITTDNINNTGAPKEHSFQIKLNHNGVDLDEHTFTDEDLKNQYNKTLTTSGNEDVTGIQEVTTEAAEAPEYFTLQGVRVAEPQAGNIYLVRRAGKVEKQLVK
ncbi:MAG: hypothetical protein K2G07_00585 [Muribaculaceae bacterium]|nr:hypothetical protein [Muribaculaceae bacterium]